MEPRGLSVQETQYKLIDGSAKLRLLKTLLPQLKARGHRVLLFSQVLWQSNRRLFSLLTDFHLKFVIALNIVEDFLHGEGFKYLRLVKP
jgi:chromodomain-helicase-DNA-binding protein 4